METSTPILKKYISKKGSNERLLLNDQNEKDSPILSDISPVRKKKKRIHSIDLECDSQDIDALKNCEKNNEESKDGNTLENCEQNDENSKDANTLENCEKNDEDSLDINTLENCEKNDEDSKDENTLENCEQNDENSKDANTLENCEKNDEDSKDKNTLENCEEDDDSLDINTFKNCEKNDENSKNTYTLQNCEEDDLFDEADDDPLIIYDNKAKSTLSSDKNKDSLTPQDSCSDIEGNEKSSQSECSTEVDSSILSDETGISKLNETITEMKKAVPKYLDKIKNLNISITWELSDVLRPKKGIYYDKIGLKGPLDPEETEYLKERLQQFCEEHNIMFGGLRFCLSNKISKLNFPNDVRLKFIQYLCKDFIQDRRPLTLLNAVMKLGVRKGKFTKKEVNFLTYMYHNYTGQNLHLVCGILLNRHRFHIFKKFKRLKEAKLLGKRPSLDKKKKALELQESILDSVLTRKKNYTPDLHTRLNRKAWKAIGRENNVSPALAKAIYLCDIMPQIFADHPVNYNKFLSQIIFRLHASDWTTWENVQWNRLSGFLDDSGSFFVYATLRKIVMAYVPKEKWNNFRECSDYLYSNVLPIFEEKSARNKKVVLNRIKII